MLYTCYGVLHHINRYPWVLKYILFRYSKMIKVSYHYLPFRNEKTKRYKIKLLTSYWIIYIISQVLWLLSIKLWLNINTHNQETQIREINNLINYFVNMNFRSTKFNKQNFKKLKYFYLKYKINWNWKFSCIKCIGQ